MNNLNELIEKHNSILEEAYQISKRIEGHAKNSQFEHLILEAENRERILNLLIYIQGKIEKSITIINSKPVKLEILDLLKLWQLNINKKVEEIDEINQKILDLLNQNREETMKELSNFFKIKDSFKGYNLTNVKKY